MGVTAGGLPYPEGTDLVRSGDDSIKALAQAVDAKLLVNGFAPVGSIQGWGGAVAPGGWLLCDGTLYSRTTYASLFAAIGTTYGAGDGSTTFAVPDLRGRTPVGTSTSPAHPLGETGGAETVTLTATQLPDHVHTSAQSPTAGASGVGDQPYRANGAPDVSFRTLDGKLWATSSYGSAQLANNQPHNNMQPFTVVGWIIKAQAATPGADTMEWYSANFAANSAALTTTAARFNIGTGSGSGLTLTGGALYVTKAGIYHATASVTFYATGGTLGHNLLKIRHMRGAVEITNRSGASSLYASTAYESVSLTADFDMQVGDFIEITAENFTVSSTTIALGGANAASAVNVHRLAGPGPEGPRGPGGGAAGISVTRGTVHGTAAPAANQGDAITTPAGVLRGIAAMGGWKSTGDGIVGTVYLDGVQVGTCIMNQSHVNNAHMALLSVAITPTTVTAGTHYLYFRGTTGNFDSDPCSFFGMVTTATGTLDDPATVLNLRMGSDQTIPVNTWTKLTGWAVQHAYPVWATENAGVFTIPADGYYRAEVFASHSAASGVKIARIAVNGVSVSEQNHAANTNYDGVASTWWEGNLRAGDTVQFEYHATVAGTLQGTASGKARAIIRKLYSGGVPASASPDTPWTVPTLLNAWVDYGSNWETAAYRRVGGVVYLRGLVKNGNPMLSSVFYLPSGFRPAGDIHTPAMGFGSSAGALNIMASGEVRVNVNPGGSNGNSYISLRCPPFPADQ